MGCAAGSVLARSAENNHAAQSVEPNAWWLLFLLVTMSASIGAGIGNLFKRPILGGLCALIVVVPFGLFAWFTTGGRGLNDSIPRASQIIKPKRVVIAVDSTLNSCRI
jgi:hypothetical protein